MCYNKKESISAAKASAVTGRFVFAPMPFSVNPNICRRAKIARQKTTPSYCLAMYMLFLYEISNETLSMITLDNFRFLYLLQSGQHLSVVLLYI